MKIILAFTSLLLICSCATNNDQLVIKKISQKDRIYSGRIFVDFNGKKNAEAKCEFYVNSGIIPDLKLTPEGYVFFKSDSKSFRFSRIACYDQPDFYTAAWHFQKLPLEKFFRSESPNTATYFGDIYITWKFNPEETKQAALQDQASPQFPKVGRIENSGVLQIEVRDAFAEHQKVFGEKVVNKAWSADNTLTTVENHPVKIVQE